MSREDWEVFEEIRRERQEKRAERRAEWRKQIEELVAPRTGLMAGFTQMNAVARSARRALFDGSGWTRHTDAHYSRTLLGDRLDYWPGPCKWRWRGTTMTGDVNQFIEAREHQGADK